MQLLDLFDEIARTADTALHWGPQPPHQPCPKCHRRYFWRPMNGPWLCYTCSPYEDPTDVSQATIVPKRREPR